MNHSERKALTRRFWRLRFALYGLQFLLVTVLYMILGLLRIGHIFDLIVSTIFIIAIWGVCACFKTSRILLLGSIDSAVDSIALQMEEAAEQEEQTLPPITR